MLERQPDRPGYEGSRWRDAYSFEYRYSEATVATVDKDVRDSKSSLVQHRNNVMMEDVAEDFTVVTVRETVNGRGTFRSFVKKTDGNGVLHSIELPHSVIQRIDQQVESLKREARSRRATAAAETRKANGVVPFQSKDLTDAEIADEYERQAAITSPDV